MASNIHISEAESLVMEALWHRPGMAAEDVIATLADKQQWQEATVKTLLNRLLKKGAISAQKDGRRFLYSPVLLREDWVASESTGLIDRLFGGNLAPLVAHFGQHRKLSKAEAEEIKKLIEGMSEGMSDGK
ncbi:BlaI/MecI/CopY family transcriptional regulator [Massilia glaciei]|uniref:BlaI/MecI/CopY family transcriptional regulator n=1 Tax=Massilia glaciei TaxID=1524097 RepID=A0A2U2HP77_9BURK|nr:BlaI/MecI/CopY family transcriptional regulator [Massilia glaciei]PWF49236.1 BlaI/MecI/CopY family transcriptional regulator [Massilia glaciei]